MKLSDRRSIWFSAAILSFLPALAPQGAAQTITTYAGGGANNPVATSAEIAYPASVAVDSGGNIYITSAGAQYVFKVTPSGALSVVAGNGISGFGGDGGPATSARLRSPQGVAVDSAGNVYIADYGNSRVRRVDAATGSITTVAGDGTCGYTGDGGPASSSTLCDPGGVAVDASGDLFIADSANNVIREVVAATGTITTVAGNGTAGYTGDGGPATSASLTFPGGVAVDGSGNLFIVVSSNDVIREVVAATHNIMTVAGNGTPGYSGDGGPATSASLSSPNGVAVDGAGNLLIGDTGNARVRRVAAATGVITTVAGNGTFGFSGDGSAALSASLNSPQGLAVDASANLFIADASNQRIRRIAAATGTITTVAGGGSGGDGGPATSGITDGVAGVAVDSSGNVFTTDVARIRRVDTATGIITTVAGNGIYGFSGDGGAASSATLGFDSGVAVDSAGNVFIADTGNSRIRRVDAVTGTITTVAGNGTFGYTGDGGPATSASLGHPWDVAVDGSGNLFIADTYNNVIRKVAASTGIITTVAGNGTPG